jgi:hypothetical protein
MHCYSHTFNTVTILLFQIDANLLKGINSFSHIILILLSRQEQLTNVSKLVDFRPTVPGAVNYVTNLERRISHYRQT